jgi:hypothetical protein
VNALHPLLQLIGMAIVMCGLIVLQVYAILFILVKKTGGSVKSEAIYVVICVITLLFALGISLIYL